MVPSFSSSFIWTGSSSGKALGGSFVRALIEEAGRTGRAVTLGVVNINPARRLYERLGVPPTHEDQYKFYTRREPDRIDATPDEACIGPV